VFRRNKSESESAASPVVEKVGGKGRPTPTRKEAEAAAKARAKAPRNRKEQAKAQRAQRMANSNKVRQAMKTGDERYYLPRDKGPVKRFVRDFVDSRFSFIELMLPLLLVTMFMTYSGSAQLAAIGNKVLLGTLLLVLVDVLLMRRRLRRELGRRFPDESLKGTTSYAVMRSLQMKFMRLPKPQVKIGQELPEHYR
jgi:hypothetical protein